VGAQLNLGGMYVKGWGIPQDHIQAHMWYNLAAANSLWGTEREMALRYRDWVATRLPPIQLAEAQACARRWQPKPETSGQYPQALPSPPQSTPSQGSPRRALVRQVQTRLQAEGFRPGTLDGTLVVQHARVDRLENGIQPFQLDGETGSTCQYQVDGPLGPQTQQALRWFQNARGLLATGDLDGPTLDALGVR
jgi:TPR repeat protein